MAESKLANTDLAAQAAEREMMPLLAKLIKDAKASPTADEELMLKMPVVKEMTIFFNELFSGEPPKKIYDDILAYVRKRYGHLVSSAGKAAAAEKAKAAAAEAARKKEEAALAAEEAKRASALKREMDAEARKEAEAKRKAEAAADAARKKAMEANLQADQATRDAARKKEAEADRQKAEKMQKELDDAERARLIKSSPGKCECCNELILDKEYLQDGQDLVHVKCRADFGRVLADRKRKAEAEEASRKAMLARSVGQCIHCKSHIVDKEYLSIGDKKLHEGCRKNYEDFMKNKCEQCMGLLTGEYIEFGVKGAGWGVKLHDDCLTAYKKATRPDCAKCGKQILDNKRLESMGKHYHVGCAPNAAREKEEAAAEAARKKALAEEEASRKAKLARSVGQCIHCKAPIMDKEYLALGDKKLHKGCLKNYESFMKNKCEQCGRGFVGDYIEFGAKGAGWGVKLHDDCLTAYKKATRPDCAKCKIQILEDKRLEVRGQHYHVACVPK